MSTCADQMTTADLSNSFVGDQPSTTLTPPLIEPLAPQPALIPQPALAPQPMLATTEEAAQQATSPAAQAAAPSTASGAKRNRRSRRDRRRRKGQTEGASLTRLAALLGQIKEACSKEGDRSAIAVKVAPMIESATQIVEKLSQAQQKAEAAASPSTQTEATVPTSTDSPTKVVRNGSNEEASNKINNQRALSRRLPRDLLPGTKIPPHFYKPQSADFDFGHSSYSPSANQTMNLYHKSSSAVFPPPMKARPLASKHARESMKREKEQLEIRNDLRNARTIADYERVLAISERFKMDYESQAARARIVKLQQAATQLQADKVLLA